MTTEEDDNLNINKAASGQTLLVLVKILTEVSQFGSVCSGDSTSSSDELFAVSTKTKTFENHETLGLSHLKLM